MIFHEDLLPIEKIQESPNLFAKILTEKFCGDKWARELPDSDVEFLSEIISKLTESTIDYRQFNEILLLINQDTISKDFFNFCFETDKINFELLFLGLKKLRGFCLLCYGNFRHPYKSFGKYIEDELKEAFSPYNVRSEYKLDRYQKRLDKMLKIEKIDKYNTCFLGYISGKTLKRESNKLDQETELETPHEGIYSAEELENLGKYFEDVENNLIETIKIGSKNTDKYLTWDYLDVYIATSMRNEWEFEQVYDFIEELSKQETLGDLNLRFFDPTQSYCKNPRDKGLIEGLMLKRASCTIYLAQESDTMGKDSELAASLAQGKPVIVYVPEPAPKKYAQKIMDFPLSYFKKRFLSLEANDRMDDEEVITKLITDFGVDYEDYINNFLEEVGKYRKKQPYSLWKEKEEEFKAQQENFEIVCQILSEIECHHYNKRAETLRDNHPLSMQVVLETGVANGVMVVRNPGDCARLLRALILNAMEFDIQLEVFDEENALGVTESHTILRERISASAFRIVTHQERLTNSFWNNFWKRG